MCLWHAAKHAAGGKGNALAPARTRELAHVGEGVLQAVCQLESVHVAQPELHVGIHYQLGQAQNLQGEQAGRAGCREKMFTID